MTGSLSVKSHGGRWLIPSQSYRDVEELLAKGGIEFDPVTECETSRGSYAAWGHTEPTTSPTEIGVIPVSGGRGCERA